MSAVPPPPYQLREIEFVQIGVEFDADAIRPLLPPGLRLGAEALGGFYCYSAPTGWGIAPYSATLVFVDVEGYPSADGSRGRAMLAGLYSGLAATALRTHLRLPVLDGGARIEAGGDGTRAIGFCAGEDVIRLEVGPAAAEPAVRGGVHYYLGAIDGGPLHVMPVAFCFPFRAATPIAVDIIGGDERLARLRPKRLVWGGRHHDASITLGAPYVLPAQTTALQMEETRVGALNLLAEIGKAAVLVDRSGKVAFVNDAAGPLLDAAFVISAGRLRTKVRSDQAALDRLINAALTTGPRSASLPPIAAQRPDAQRPLIVRALAIGSRHPDGALPDDAAAALLITDPDLRTTGDAQSALQLLGLTRSEARVAGLVGSGLPPRAVAERLGNTERTVRFMLGRAFAKLDISRQSELASIVARLAE